MSVSDQHIVSMISRSNSAESAEAVREERSNSKSQYWFPDIFVTTILLVVVVVSYYMYDAVIEAVTAVHICIFNLNFLKLIKS